ncbi:MAG: HlyD family secretion protein [Gammaproteobacteria bacterium]|nr:HlyD family secretion protein [Gammaproteobacteria bacterium]
MEVELPSAAESDGEAPVRGSRWTRPILLWVLPSIVVVAGVVLYGMGGRYASTDNAYLKEDRVDVAAQVSGDVREVRVAENQPVEPGQVVLVLDDTLPRVAVQRAEAELARARVDVEGLRAAYREKLGELEVARDTQKYAVDEFERQRQLADRKLVPASQLDSAHRSADLAVGTVGILQLQAEQARARLGDPDLPTDRHPEVLAAAAELARARVDLERTVVKAPRAGVVSHLPQVGDRVNAGQPAFAVVTSRSLWVEANFKETDLEWVRPGQHATIEVDTYPGREWTGTVESISQATGAEFSLLPPQNASGNWVKVVQRIPVRIAIDVQPDDPPLRSGASARVEIDTGAHRRIDRWLQSLR